MILLGSILLGLLAIWLALAMVEMFRLGIGLRQAFLYVPLKLIYRIGDSPIRAASKADAPVIYAIWHQSRIDPALMLSLLPDDTLHIEHFESTLRTLDPSREHAFDVELKDSGIVVHVAADQTVLSALRAANIDVQSDCEEGLCGSCEVRVLAGKVDHRDVVLTRAEREADVKMMTCCSRACGDRLVLEL